MIALTIRGVNAPVLQEAAIRLLQDNIEHYCRLLQPAFDKLQMEANVTRCAHGTALVSVLGCISLQHLKH